MPSVTRGAGASRVLGCAAAALLFGGVVACSVQQSGGAVEAAEPSRCVTPADAVLDRFRLPEGWTFAETTRDGDALRWGMGGRSEERIVLILPGLEEPIEIYGEMARVLVEQGAEVYAVDWRHQGLSVRNAPDPQRVNVADFAIYLADLDAVAADALEARLADFDGEFVVVGASMGGHLAIRWAEGRDDIDRMVLLAPAIRLYGAPRWAWSAGLDVAATVGDEYAAGQGPWDEAESLAECGGLGVSSYEPRAAAWHHLLIRDPALRTGGPTYNWLAAIVASSYDIDALEPGYASAEILILSSDQDRYVDNDAHRDFCARMGESCAVVTLNAKHSPFLERDRVFDTIIQEILDAPVFGRPMTGPLSPRGGE